MAQPNTPTATPTVKEFSAQGFPTDFEFIVGTGDSQTVFKVHKTIVIPLSSVFTATIVDKWEESLTGKMHTVEYLGKLLRFADKFNVPSINRGIANHLEAIWTTPPTLRANQPLVVDFFLLAVEYGLEDHVKRCERAVLTLEGNDMVNVFDRVAKIDPKYAYCLSRQKLAPIKVKPRRV